MSECADEVGARKLTVAAARVHCGIADRLFSIDSSNGRDAVQRDADFAASQLTVDDHSRVSA
jgi:hypothetical protein